MSEGCDRLDRLAKWVVLRALGLASSCSRAQDGAILCFHSIGGRAAPRNRLRPTGLLSVSSAFLEALIVNLRRREVDLVSLDEALARAKHRGGQRFVAITLDDGYADNFTEGFPVFLRHRVPVTLFLTTGYIDRTRLMWWVAFDRLIDNRATLVLPQGKVPTRNADEKAVALAISRDFVMRLPPERQPEFLDWLFEVNAGAEARNATEGASLHWPQVSEMVASGLVTVGCHTVSHPVLSGLDRETCIAEITCARDRITEKLGQAPRFFAYPYGGEAQVGRAAPKLVAAAGFAAAFTTCRGLLDGTSMDPYAVPRISLEAEDLLLARAYISGLPYVLRSDARRITDAA